MIEGTFVEYECVNADTDRMALHLLDTAQPVHVTIECVQDGRCSTVHLSDSDARNLCHRIMEHLGE